jgi:hypothetical protein
MQKDPLVALLVGALCVCAVFTFAETVGYELHLRQLKSLQPQLATVQNAQVIVNSLVNDTIEYSKHNPAITPILQATLKPSAAPAAKPAAK